MAEEPGIQLDHGVRALVEERLETLKYLRHRATIDADAHISDPTMCDRLRAGRSDDYFHGKPISAEELLAEMDSAEVDLALCWQNPAATAYSGDEEGNFEALLRANVYVGDSARRFPDRIIPAGWTDPQNLGAAGACRMVDYCVGRLGFGIIKMNPAQNGYAIDGAEVRTVVDRILAWGATPAFHYGADTEYTPAEGLEKVAKRIAPHPLIAVHMGGGGASYLEAEPLYIESRKLGLRQSNIHFICSARRETHTESDLITYEYSGEPFRRNISLGSDAPYGRVAWNFGGYRAMFAGLRDNDTSRRHVDSRLRERPELFSRESVQNYLGTNIADLVIRAYAEILSSSDSRT